MPPQAYLRTFELLRKRLLDGEFRKGLPLPPERLLCQQMGVSRITMRHAMRLLQEQGLIERYAGRGTFARPAGQHRIRIFTSDFPGSMRRDAPGSVRKLLSRAVVTPDRQTAESLGLLPGEQCAQAERLDLAGREPLACDRALIPLALAGSLTDEILVRVDFLDLWMSAEGLALSHGSQSIEASGADARAAALLKIRRGTPVLHTTDIIHAVGGRVVARFDSVFRGDRYRLISTVRLDAAEGS